MSGSGAQHSGAIRTFAPTDADAQLLRFDLAQEAGLDAWYAWRERTEIQDVAGATHELLPATYKRLASLGYGGPELGRLRGIYRYHWTRSQQHRSSARAALSALEDARVVHVGPADVAAAEHLEEAATLPLQVPRIAVPYERAGAALRALATAGWSVDTTSRAGRSARARLVQTEWQLSDEDGHVAILTNHYNPLLRNRGLERQFWLRTSGTSSRARLASSRDLLLAMLTDSIAYPNALRWAVASVGLARALEASGDEPLGLNHLIATPAMRFLLEPLEARLVYVTDVVPESETLRRALQVVRTQLAEPDPRDLASPSRLRVALSGPPHLVEASVRILRRFDGPRGAWRYLQATR